MSVAQWADGTPLKKKTVATLFAVFRGLIA